MNLLISQVSGCFVWVMYVLFLMAVVLIGCYNALRYSSKVIIIPYSALASCKIVRTDGYHLGGSPSSKIDSISIWYDLGNAMY